MSLGQCEGNLRIEDPYNFIINNSEFRNNTGSLGGGTNIHKDVY